MGWVDTGKIIEQFEQFQDHKMVVAVVFIVLVAMK